MLLGENLSCYNERSELHVNLISEANYVQLN